MSFTVRLVRSILSEAMDYVIRLSFILLISTSVDACTFVERDISAVDNLEFQFSLTHSMVHQVACLIQCGLSTSCAMVIWNEESAECSAAAVSNHLGEKTRSPAAGRKMYIKEEYAHANGGIL